MNRCALMRFCGRERFVHGRLYEVRYISPPKYKPELSNHLWVSVQGKHIAYGSLEKFLQVWEHIRH